MEPTKLKGNDREGTAESLAAVARCQTCQDWTRSAVKELFGQDAQYPFAVASTRARYALGGSAAALAAPFAFGLRGWKAVVCALVFVFLVVLVAWYC